MMQKRIELKRCVILILAAACVSLAEPEFQSGLQVEYVNYREPGVMSEQGMLAGLCASLGSDLYTDTDWRMKASYVMGNLSYQSDDQTGLDLSGSTPNRILDARGEIGHRFLTGGKALHLYTGAAGRLLIDDLPGFSGLQGYTREQTYIYVPVGMDVILTTNQTRTITARLEYDWFIKGQNKSADITMNQNSGYGCQAALNISDNRDFLCFSRLGVEPFFQYWNIGKSDHGANTFYEPANSSTMFGLRVTGTF
jgi:hypothetical protein